MQKQGVMVDGEKEGTGGLTPEQLAVQTKTSCRYAREWLEMQAVAGWVHCLNPNEKVGNKRRFILPAEHAEVLANKDSLSYLLPLSLIMAGTGKMADKLVEAYRNDTGVSWDEIGTDAREGMAAMNRPFFLQLLPSQLEGILDPVIVKKLHHGNGKVLDVGAGYAWSSIGMAQYFAAAYVEVYDVDAPSIDKARQNITEAGLEDRVVAHCADVAAHASNNENTFDLAMALECIHDMPDPISVLRAMHKMVKKDGTVIVMDELTNHKFLTHQENKNPMEQALYGFSCLCCLPDGKSSPSSVETGAVMRPSVLRMYAQQAGFRDIEILPIENDMFRFYKLLIQ